MTPPQRRGWQEICSDPAATDSAAARLADLLRPGDILLLNGPLGAGKTHFTRALVNALGSSDRVSSPTYVLQKIYDVPASPQARGIARIVHYDAYRIQNHHQLLELDFHAMAADAVSIVEWGERFAEYLPEATVRVELAPIADDATGQARTLRIDFLREF